MSKSETLNASSDRLSRTIAWCVALLAAVGLTVVFWLPLWSGGGLVGGDVYSYYFPQKVFYAEQLHDGEFPLWNNRTGWGYPLIGESQTGAFYPFHLLVYSSFEANTAYNVSHLAHYALAFLFVFAFARTIGLGTIASLFAALVYTYGWFPPRSCVEWAIIGGAWFPAALWSAELFLRTRFWRYGIALSIVLALQMLAGHFQIAWITQLVLLVYVPARVYFAQDSGRDVQQKSRWLAVVTLFVAMAAGFGLASVQLLPTWELKQRSQRSSVGDHHDPNFGMIPPRYLAQTVCPWYWYSPLMNRDAELQRMLENVGSRTNAVEAHLYFGLIPLVLAIWSVIEAIRTRDRQRFLWCGLALLAVVLAVGWLSPIVSRVPGFAFFAGLGRYTIVTALAVAVLSGRMLDTLLTRQRLTMSEIAVLIVAVLAAAFSCFALMSDAEFVAREAMVPDPLFGMSTDMPRLCVKALLITGIAGVLIFALLESRSQNKQGKRAKGVLVATLFAVTVVDFWVVSRSITYTQMVSVSPIQLLAQSPVRRRLLECSEPVRLFAPGANFPNVLGVASLPVYLTFGPKEYVDPALLMPPSPDTEHSAFQIFSQRQITWMKRAGVTHILSFHPVQVSSQRDTQGDTSSPLSPGSAGERDRVRGLLTQNRTSQTATISTSSPKNDRDIRLIWQGDDPILNRAWARIGQPLYLYEMKDSPGRLRWEHSEHDGSVSAHVRENQANRIVIDATTERANRLILTDLDFPGWKVTVDNQPAQTHRVEDLFRAVDVPTGEHCIVWEYQPSSVFRGGIISLCFAFILAAIAHVRFWHPNWFRQKTCREKGPE